MSWKRLQALRARVGTGDGMAVSTIGVLTRVDQFCDLERLREGSGRP